MKETKQFCLSCTLNILGIISVTGLILATLPWGWVLYYLQ